MSENRIKRIELQCQSINQLLVLSVAAIAAAVAFLQVKGISPNILIAVKICIGLLAGSIMLAFISLIATIPQLEEDEPCFDSFSIRYTYLLSITLFFVAVAMFAISACFISASPQSDVKKNDSFFCSKILELSATSVRSNLGEMRIGDQID